MRERLPDWLHSLTANYVAFFFLLVAAPAAGVAAYLLNASYNDNRQALIRQQEEKAGSLAAAANLYFSTLTDQLKGVSANGLSRTQLASELERFSGPRTFSIFYIDGRGRETLVNAGGLVPGSRQVGKQALFRVARKRGAYFGPVDTFATYTITVAVAEAGGPGVVGTRFSLGEAYGGERSNESTVLGLIRSLRPGSAGYAYAVDPNARTAIDPVYTGFSSSVGGLPQVREALSSTKPVGSAIGRNVNGKKVLSAWATVPATGWRVFVEQPESAAFAPLRGKIWKTALLIAALVAAAVALSVLLARRLVQPIKRLQVAAEAIGAGAYEQRIELDRRDELGALAASFNRMAERLQELISGLERTVAERTRQLELASRHKSEFLANMSHELRTPLNAIVGFSQVLKQRLFGEVNDKQGEYLDDILSSADHLLSLINDILDLSKVEAGQVELEPALFSLREALERGIVMVREKATRNGISLELSLDDSVDLVEADQRRIRQVVFNLLSNAVKFTPAGGAIDVSASRVDGEVRVAVSDTGPGIAPEDQQRIFEEFQQARQGNGQRPEGTGLGLALSKKLIELHGGRLWVDSEPGQGSTFTFTIPVGSR